ncbi:MAG: hypothetical protein NT121_18065 [Chloroflexi bacterium]|nr:hypothetical protein [Chloroflexota bacterium]
MKNLIQIGREFNIAADLSSVLQMIWAAALGLIYSARDCKTCSGLDAFSKIGKADYNGDDATILVTLAKYAALVTQKTQRQTQLEKTRNEDIRIEKTKNDFVVCHSLKIHIRFPSTGKILAG